MKTLLRVTAPITCILTVMFAMIPVASSQVSMKQHLLPDTMHTVYDISFATDSIGFIQTWHNEVYRTSDEGRTWTEVPYAATVHALDSVHVYALSDFGIFRKSSDAGLTWESKQIEKPCLCQFFQIYFLDTMHGYAMAGWLDNNDPNAGGGVFTRTTDGGESWTPTVIPNPRLVGEIVFIDSLKGFALQSQQDLYKTVDAGNNWQKANANGRNIFYFGDGIVVTPSYISTNFGENWTKKLAGGLILDGVNGIAYAASVHHLQDSLMVTLDSGRSWSFVMELPFPADKIEVPSNRVIYLTGSYPGKYDKTYILQINLDAKASVELNSPEMGSNDSRSISRGDHYDLGQNNSGYILYNLFGQRVSQSAWPTEYLNTSELTPGLYLLRVGGETQRLLIY